MSRADKKDGVPVNWVDKGSRLGRPVLDAKWLVKEGKRNDGNRTDDGCALTMGSRVTFHSEEQG